MSNEQVYEMLWDCKYCGTKKLLGKTHRHCPNCGAAQDDEARYFPSDAEKVAVEDHVYHGVDVICPNCDTLNSAISKFCQQCGTALDSAEQAQLVRDDQVIRDGEQFESTGSVNVAQERFEQKMVAAGLRPESEGRKSGTNKRTILVGLGLLAVVIILGLVAIFWKQDITAYVSAHSWSREIRIESFEPRQSSAWCDAMPGDAYSITRRTEQRGSKQVPDGEQCSTIRVDNGDGTFSERRQCTTRYRSEPVYDDRCYFTVDRWDYERSVNASGGSLREDPYWPETNISRSGTCIGCEREGGREDHYLINLVSGENEYTCDLDQDMWSNIPIESVWKFQVGVISNQPDCSRLEPASN